MSPSDELVGGHDSIKEKIKESSLTTPNQQIIHDSIDPSQLSNSPITDEFDEFEDEDDDLAVKDFEANQSKERPVINKRFSKTDADSIVGGESFTQIESNDVNLGNNKTSHPISDAGKPSDEQSKKIAGTTIDPLNEDKFTDHNHGLFADSQKVFSFSLPFGGFSNIRSNIYKQLKSFNIDQHLPSFQFINNKNQQDDIDDIRLRLQRQQSVTTVEEARYFENNKGPDAVRLRAVKASISSNINEIIPDFMHAKKDKNLIKPSESIYNDIDGNIVLLGGYRGSILRDSKTRKRVWIPLKAGFNLRKINLLLGPNVEDELKASNFIYPDGVLKNIGPIDICKKLLKKLDSNPKTNVKEFGYDWRLSLSLSSEKLEEFLTKIYKDTGKPTLVIAHSMGGLVAHLTMQRCPHLFRGVVYVGVPSECLNILGPIRFGDSVIFSDKILTFESNFMMRSSFCFLPLNGRVFVNKDTKECYDLDYFNPDTWVEYNLNPLVSKRRLLQEINGINSSNSPDSNSSLSFSPINSLSTKFRNYRSLSIAKKNKSLSNSPTRTFPHDHSDESNDNTSPLPEQFKSSPQLEPNSMEPSSHSSNVFPTHFSFSFNDAYNYLAETLKLAKKFVLGLNYDPSLDSKYPPLAVVYGNKVPSVRGSNVRSIQDIKDGNYYEFFYGHGDGVVHQKWLMPEQKGFSMYDEKSGKGQIVGKFSSPAGHVNLMTDFEAMGNALYSIIEAEKSWSKKKKNCINDTVLEKSNNHTFNIPLSSNKSSNKGSNKTLIV